MKSTIVSVASFAILVLTCSCRDNVKQYDEDIMQDESIVKLQSDSATVSDLALICKCWGFVKYYYPNIEKAGVDINNELFEILDNYCDTRNAPEVLCRWNDSIGRYKRLKWKRINPKPLDYYSNCDLRWIADTSYLDAGLSERLLEILSYRRSKGNYSKTSSFGVIYHNTIPNRNGELSDLDNAKQRLLLLFTYWNVIEYYYCLKQPDLGWNELLYGYLPMFMSGNGRKCLIELKSLSSYLHDSHGIIRSNNDAPVKFIPLNVRMVDSLFFVVGECGNCIPVGSTILTVDGETPIETLTNLKDSLYYNYSNYPSLLQAVTWTGLLSVKDSVSVEYINNGKKNIEVIKTIDMDEAKIWDDKYRSGAIEDCQLVEDVCYMNAGAFVSSKEKEYLETIKQSNMLIMDLRFYPNEMMIAFITKYIIPDDRPFVMFDMPSWNEPGSSKKVTSRFKSSDYSYDGRIVVLVNENTLSQGEYTAMAMQANPRSVTIGAETCGSDGDMSVILLPGGISAYFTSMGIYYPDGEATQRLGVRIDKHLDPHIIDTMYYNPISISNYIKLTLIDE